MNTNQIEIIMPDDFHNHFRDGEVLKGTVYHAMKRFGRCIAMPNTVPPIRNKTEAHRYFLRIMKAYMNVAKEKNMFQPLMTLYLTDKTTPQDIQDAYNYGILACKLYPAGATTNSEYGVTNINNIHDVLSEMSKCRIILLVHCEVTDKKYDIFDREKYGIELMLKPIINKFPDLKIVMEHITTKEGVDFVKNSGPNIAATITAHHLLYTRNDLLVGGIKPHMYCLPILKTEIDRIALLDAATSGNPKFFLGTDSAPHTIDKKESSCGCAGIYTAHAAIELYAEAFDSVGKIDMLEGFSSIYGAKFYNLPINREKLTLKKSRNGKIIPEKYYLGNMSVKPLRNGNKIKWYIEGNNYNIISFL